jgi:hypothetical protein
VAKKPSDANKLAAAAKRAVTAANKAANDVEIELVAFKTGDKTLAFNIDVTNETVWATQQQIADLFERGRRTIGEHVASIFAEGELEEQSVSRKFRLTANDGKTYEITHYDLDAILAVGFRVKSPKAAQFRKWAYQTLRSYIVDGYAINEARLKDDPQALNVLAAKLRELRASEKNVYANVREFFKIASTDYDAGSRQCSRFYALLQDKFHYAVTQRTAARIVLERADHNKPNMGLQSFEGNLPTIDEAKIGKNYLDSDELYVMHILCEQFLLYVESKAMRGKKMTMAELANKLDELFKVNEYPVFPGWKDYIKDQAIRHAQAEYAMFLVRLKADDVKRIPKPRTAPA